MSKDKQRKHKVVLYVTFDRPCTPSYAAAAVLNNFDGTYYTDDWSTKNAPQEFRVRTATTPTRAGFVEKPKRP